jgi:hypothetical protein
MLSLNFYNIHHKTRMCKTSNINKTVSRDMWSRYSNNIKKALRPKIANDLQSIRPYAKHSVHKPSVMKTNHEENQENPIFTKTNKTGKQTPSQHFPVTKTVCDKPGCINITCSNICGVIVETRVVGHATHSDSVPGKHVRRIANTDFNNQPKEQYMVYYDKRPLSDLTEDTVHVEGTKKLTDDYQTFEKFYDK